jgi:phosphoglycolate phosphatase-like HAD superfamily hydrolase/ADP-ribose pyrophosphatase YjhB (NUDIX family)
MISTILFDWSGTLADDLGAVLQATNKVFEHYGRPGMSRQEFRREFALPFGGFYDRFLPGIPLQELDDRYHLHFDPLNERVELLPHAREFLDFCRQTDRRMFILSSIRPIHFEKQAGRLGVIDYFDHLYTGVQDKAKLIRRIVEERGLDPVHTAFIGDMEHDMETAREGGVLGIGVGTGYDTRDDLTRAGADIVVSDLAQLRRVMTASGPRAGVGEPAGHPVPIPTVGALILNPENKMLMVHTTKWRGTWGIPGGKIQEGETQEQALRREILEETALELQDIRFVMVHDSVFSPEFHKPAHFLLLNYLARTQSSQVTLNDEATEYRWVTLPEARAMNLNQPTITLLERLRADGLLEERPHVS